MISRYGNYVGKVIGIQSPNTMQEQILLVGHEEFGASSREPA